MEFETSCVIFCEFIIVMFPFCLEKDAEGCFVWEEMSTKM